MDPREKFIATKWPVMTSANGINVRGDEQVMLRRETTDWKIGENDTLVIFYE